MRRYYVSCVIVALVALSSRALAYHDATYHFSITAPPGWQQISPNPAGATNGSPRGPSSFGVEFKPIDGPTGTMVIVRAEQKSLTLDEVERAVQEYPSRRKPLPFSVSFLPSVKQHSVKFDRAKRMVTMEMDVMEPGHGDNGKITHCIGNVLIGKDTITHIHFFTLAMNQQQYQPAFAAMMNSFQFDKGYEYTQAAAPAPTAAAVASTPTNTSRGNSRANAARKAGAAAVNWAIFLAGMGALVAWLIYINRRQVM